MQKSLADAVYGCQCERHSREVHSSWPHGRTRPSLNGVLALSVFPPRMPLRLPRTICTGNTVPHSISICEVCKPTFQKKHMPGVSSSTQHRVALIDLLAELSTVKRSIPDRTCFSHSLAASWGCRAVPFPGVKTLQSIQLQATRRASTDRRFHPQRCCLR
jgi:hypothetical protein